MSVAVYVMIFVGILTFLIGYWFLAYNWGEYSCNTGVSKASYIGGIVGLVLGLLLILVGIIMNSVSVV